MIHGGAAQRTEKNSFVLEYEQVFEMVFVIN